jgi:hypothetical protein
MSLREVATCNRLIASDRLGAPRPAGRSTAEMIAACFRHQHPEAYGRPEVSEPHLPEQVRFGRDVVHATREVVPEEPMAVAEPVPFPPVHEGEAERVT